MERFYSGANCDIYIGKGAGKKLLYELRSAKKSVRIVSPYLSAALVKELIILRQKKVKVELVTTDEIEDYRRGKEQNIKKLILQRKVADKEAIKIIEDWRNTSLVLFFLMALIIAIFVGLAYTVREAWVGIGFIPLLAIIFYYIYYDSKVSRLDTFYYKYLQLFPFRVFISPEKMRKGNTFIHSKMYLIDDRIAYLGSLNFTISGLKKNHETVIRTEDPNVVEHVRNEIYQLMKDTKLPKKDIQRWGREIYETPYRDEE